MNIIIRIAASGLLGCALPAAALAQDTPSPPPMSQVPHDQPSAVPPAPTPPAPPIQGAPDTPNLSVATVKMDGGIRASKIIGATVVGAGNQELGTINDLVLDKDGRVVLGVISVGAVLGMGGKLVAKPYDQFKPGDAGKLMLPGASKDTLAKEPGFTYAE